MRVAATFSQSAASTAPLIDGIGRRISYLRLSVTDRCDLRCRYCMAEDMTFLPKSAVLSIEEMGDLAERFVARGINRIRLTGGEPLVRRVLAARAADMPAIGFVGGGHAGPDLAARLTEAGATRVIAHMRDLPEAIAALQSGAP